MKNDFAVGLRKARLNSDMTFREIAKYIGKSIGYLSEIENGKKNPPEKALVEKIEICLGVTDGHLVKLADEVRFNLPKSINNLVKTRPEFSEFLQLSELLFREDENFPDELENFLNTMREKSGQLAIKDGRLFFSCCAVLEAKDYGRRVGTWVDL